MEKHIQFTTAPIIVPATRITSPETGAEVEFRGLVREMEQGHAIAGLQYEAYLPMAEREIERIIDQLGETWSCHSVWFIHRLGWVPVSEASLYIRVHASHREAAFRLCMGIIDEMKRDAPIWKCSEPRPPH